MAIRGPLLRGDLPGLFERTWTLLHAARVETLVCEIEDVTADVVTAEALARVALAARRLGCRTQLRGASPELRALIDLIGLAEVLGVIDDGLPGPL